MAALRKPVRADHHQRGAGHRCHHSDLPVNPHSHQDDGRPSHESGPVGQRRCDCRHHRCGHVASNHEVDGQHREEVRGQPCGPAHGVEEVPGPVRREEQGSHEHSQDGPQRHGKVAHPGQPRPQESDLHDHQRQHPEAEADVGSSEQRDVGHVGELGERQQVLGVEGGQAREVDGPVVVVGLGEDRPVVGVLDVGAATDPVRHPQ